MKNDSKKNNILLILIFFMFLISGGLPVFLIYFIDGQLSQSSLIVGSGAVLLLTLIMVVASAFILKPIEGLFSYIGDMLDPSKEFSDQHVMHGIGMFGELVDSINEVRGRIHKIDVLTQALADGKYQKTVIDLPSDDITKKSFESSKKNFSRFQNEIEEAFFALSIGQFDYQIDEKGFVNDYLELIKGLNRLLRLYSRRFDSLAVPIMTIDSNYTIQYISETTAQLFGKSKAEVVGMKCYDYMKTEDCRDGSCACRQAMTTRESVKAKTTTASSGSQEKRYIHYSGEPLFSASGEVLGAIEIIWDETESTLGKMQLEKEHDYQKQQAGLILENLKRLSEGNFVLDVSLEESDSDLYEVSQIYKTINRHLLESTKTISSVTKEMNQLLRSVSKGNLNLRIEEEYPGEFYAMKQGLESVVDSLNHMIQQIKETSHEVSHSVRSISDHTKQLSQATTSQASAVTEISATISQLSSQVKENADHSEKVMQVASNNQEVAGYGNGQMIQLVESMREIQESTLSIQKVLKMINDIAFQTNILSLNAAVEAARAGQHGKGFAVIAEDVRNLALKSASAADETSDMLELMISKITGGSKLAKETARSLSQIVDGARKTVELSSNVSKASFEQAHAVNQMTTSLEEVSSLVNDTSARAINEAKTSESLNRNTKQLVDLVSGFTLK